MKTQWFTVDEKRPDEGWFCWVIANGVVDLAYVTPSYSSPPAPIRFETATSAGDAEGLHTDYIDDVRFWSELIEPDLPVVLEGDAH